MEINGKGFKQFIKFIANFTILDEMYAAIEEPSNPVYTSGSETYAQIQPPLSQPIPIVITTTTIANTRSSNVQTNTTVFSATTSVQSIETVDVNPR